jgi:endoglycosylceramidase
LSQRFAPATGDYALRLRADHAVTAPTSIVVPRRAYPAGYTVVVDGGEVTSAPDAGRLTVEADPTADVVTVTVRRA